MYFFKKYYLFLVPAIFLSDNLIFGQIKPQNKRILPMVKPALEAKSLPGKTSRIQAKTLNQEIKFWLNQFKEHLIYLKQGIGDSQTNKDLMKKVLNFRKQLENNKPLSKDFLNDYKKFLNELENYKNSAKPKSKNNKILEALVKHMLEELQYHRENVDGAKRAKDEEVKFWTKHDTEVSSLKAKKLTANSEEKKLLTKLEQLGINNHENREDRYAKSRMAR